MCSRKSNKRAICVSMKMCAKCKAENPYNAIYCHLCGYKLHKNKFKNFMRSEWPPIILGVFGMCLAGLAGMLLEFFNTNMEIPVLIAGGFLIVVSVVWIKVRN